MQEVVFGQRRQWIPTRSFLESESMAIFERNRYKALAHLGLLSMPQMVTRVAASQAVLLESLSSPQPLQECLQYGGNPLSNQSLTRCMASLCTPLAQVYLHILLRKTWWHALHACAVPFRVSRKTLGFKLELSPFPSLHRHQGSLQRPAETQPFDPLGRERCHPLLYRQCVRQK
jgi:hypothetical protein